MRTELDLLTTPGHLITTNRFLSTTRDVDVARLFVLTSATDDSTYCDVLFHITIPENLTVSRYADIG